MANTGRKYYRAVQRQRAFAGEPVHTGFLRDRKGGCYLSRSDKRTLILVSAALGVLLLFKGFGIGFFTARKLAGGCK